MENWGHGESEAEMIRRLAQETDGHDRRLTMLEASVTAARDLVEERFENFQRATTNDIGRQFDAMRAEIKGQFEELKAALIAHHDEHTKAWEEYHLPDIIDRVQQQRRDAFFAACKKWGGRLAWLLLALGLIFQQVGILDLAIHAIF